MKRFRKNEDGAALLEFALCLPLFLLMLYGVISWGYSLTLRDAMYDAAREGAREMSVGESSEVQAVVSVQEQLSIWSNNFNIVAEDVATTGTTEVVVTITADNFFNGWLPLIRVLPPLYAQVTMRKEA